MDNTTHNMTYILLYQLIIKVTKIIKELFGVE